MNCNIACVGAGNVGRAWAIRFAMSEHVVKLYDVSSTTLDSAIIAIEKSLRDLADADIIADPVQVLQRIIPCTTLAEALADVSYVQENVVEDLSLKRDVFLKLDRQTDIDVILASSTSEISGSDMFARLPGRERCIVAHPLNPPYLIPLVELCPSPWTSQETIARTRRFLSDSGQKPIVVKKEISGFIANRLQLAVLGEALHLVGEGYCSVEDIDSAMKDGLALRWAFIGPFETGHLNASAGYRAYLDIFTECHKKIIKDLKVDYDWGDGLIDRIHAELAQTTPVDDVPERQAWRDRRLMALTKHLEDDKKRYG